MEYFAAITKVKVELCAHLQRKMWMKSCSWCKAHTYNSSSLREAEAVGSQDWAQSGQVSNLVRTCLKIINRAVDVTQCKALVSVPCTGGKKSGKPGTFTPEPLSSSWQMAVGNLGAWVKGWERVDGITSCPVICCSVWQDLRASHAGNTSFWEATQVSFLLAVWRQYLLFLQRVHPFFLKFFNKDTFLNEIPIMSSFPSAQPWKVWLERWSTTFWALIIRQCWTLCVIWLATIPFP